MSNVLFVVWRLCGVVLKFNKLDFLNKILPKRNRILPSMCDLTVEKGTK